MSSVVISGNTSGTITLAAPDVAGTTTLTLPAVSGTLITSGGGYAGSFTTLTSTQGASFATSSGNVGIGTSSPTQKLHVYAASGNINTKTEAGSGSQAAVIAQNSRDYIQIAVDSTNVYVDGGTSSPMSFYAGGTERFRIGTSGQIGLSGANYGTSGQVLTSNGSGAAASWTTVSSSPTTDQVLSATAGASIGAVGTYILGYKASIEVRPGDTTSSVESSSCAANRWTSYSGTWRCMGYVTGGGSGSNVTVWLRVS